MTDIRMTATVSGVPTNALTDDPEITIRRTDNGVAVVTADAMTDRGADGLYTYDFTQVAGLNYSFLIDADPNATGQVRASERFFDGVLPNSIVNELFARVIEGTLTYEEAFKLMLADAAGTIEQLGDGSYIIKDTTDTVDRIEGELAANNGRTINARDVS